MNIISRRDYLEQFHIYSGGDITIDAACAKLCYLLSKDHSQTDIKKLIYSSVRGELTEIRKGDQFQLENQSFMELVEESIQKFYPTKKCPEFIREIEDSISRFVINESNSKEIEELFKKIDIDENMREELFREKIISLVDRNHLLHRAVQNGNEVLYKHFLMFLVDFNGLDESDCSPMFYAVAKRDKKAVLSLKKKESLVICPVDELFELIAEALLKDEREFF